MFYIAISILSLAILWMLVAVKLPTLMGLIGLGIVIWFFVWLKKKQDRLEDIFQKRFRGKEILIVDKAVVFRAQRSRGYSQISGKGYLVLTQSELYFHMVMIEMIIAIPITAITQVDQGARLLGTNPGRSMLLVDYRDEEGELDTIAMNVKDLSLWIQKIQQLIGEHNRQ